MPCFGKRLAEASTEIAQHTLSDFCLTELFELSFGLIIRWVVYLGGTMEHLVIWLIEAVIKSLTRRTNPKAPNLVGAQPRVTPSPSAAGSPASSPIDVWADYRRKQAAIEREMASKSPTVTKR